MLITLANTYIVLLLQSDKMFFAIMAAYSFHCLIIGKVEIGDFCCLIGPDMQKCVLFWHSLLVHNRVTVDALTVSQNSTVYMYSTISLTLPVDLM